MMTIKTRKDLENFIAAVTNSSTYAHGWMVYNCKTNALYGEGLTFDEGNRLYGDIEDSYAKGLRLGNVYDMRDDTHCRFFEAYSGRTLPRSYELRSIIKDAEERVADEADSPNPTIIGYNLIKDCKETGGYERCGCTLMFAVRRGASDCLSAIAEVSQDTSYENMKRMQKRWAQSDYIIWDGEVCGSEVRYYWS